MGKTISLQDATKIAEAYRTKICENRHVVYNGAFMGGYLFCLDFRGSGHHGMPIFINISRSGSLNRFEEHSDSYYKAWEASDKYLESLEAL